MIDYAAVADQALKLYQPIQEREELIGAMKFLADRKIQRVLELGIFRGGSMFCWHAVAAEDADFVGVDTPGTPPSVEQNMASWMRPGQKSLLILDDTKSGETVTRALNFLGGRIDFLFIDADHSEAGVRGDFDVWSSHVVSDGVIGFHDILETPSHPNIQVHRLWSELKSLYPQRCHEFIGPIEHQYGIGLFVKP